MTAQLKTCRFCGNTNYDYKHAAVKSAWIKYGTRHSAHLQCIAAARPEFVRDLTTWQIEQLPFMEIQALGLEPIVRDELGKRADAVALYKSGRKS
jgi:hypothetical protein